MAQAKAAEASGAPAATASPQGSTLKLRIASAMVMAPVALAALWLGTPFFPALVALGAIGMAWEWARLTGAAALPVEALLIATMLAAVLLTAFGAVLEGVALAIGGALVVGVLAASTKARAPLWTAIGTLWIAVPCMAILWVAAQAEGRAAILWLFAVVWASDIGAYAAGRVLGGPRLAPRLSPNKTWAGALGALIAATLVGLAAAWLLGGGARSMVVASLALSVAGQLGDLAESLAKRKFGVKDSGAMIPGHGGLLDRLDSLLTAAAAQGLMLWLAGGLGSGSFL